MILSGVAKRYAVALFNAAVKQDIAEQVNEDLTTFVELLRTNRNLVGFLKSPEVLTESKKKLVVDVFGDRSAGLFVQFILLLIDKKRLKHILEIADAFSQLYEQMQGIVEAKVITAIPLDADLEQRTVERLEEETNKTIRISKTVDPDIIGGMIIIVGDNILDGSIRHKLEQMRRSLGEVKVH
ncbi:MAG: F0F1 ATP synthase subunit delta [Candidatus Latescibacterota bacterium]|jgi:ATP synthase F1 delta subunit